MAQSWFQTGRALPAGRALCLPHVLRASHHDLACRTADRQVDRCARFNILSAVPAAPASDDVGGYPSAWPCPYGLCPRYSHSVERRPIETGQRGCCPPRSEEHTSETPVTNAHLVCRLLLETKKEIQIINKQHE